MTVGLIPDDGWADLQMTGDRAGEGAAAAIAGQEPDFAALAERHRRELHVHCYRMLASFDDAKD